MPSKLPQEVGQNVEDGGVFRRTDRHLRWLEAGTARPSQVWCMTDLLSEEPRRGVTSSPSAAASDLDTSGGGGSAGRECYFYSDPD